ncbi:MAG: hypothetical protein V1495_03610 [Pseudomonadota bacterium]
MKRNLILTSLALLFVGTATAQTTLSQEEPTLNRKIRNLGMGNIGVAIEGTADSSPFYNPAGLNDLEKGRFQFLTNTADVSTGAFSLATDLKDLNKGIKNATTDADKTRKFNEFIQKNTGKFQHFRYTLDIFNYARKNFAVGLLIDERLDLSFRDQSYPHFDVRNLGDATVYVSGAHAFWDKLLQAGFTLRPTVRFAVNEADQQVTLSDVLGKNAAGNSLLSEQFKKIKDRRFGLGVDFGLKSNLAFEGFKQMKIYETLKPEAGFTWQDLGNTKFGRAPTNEQSISFGTAVHPAIWKLKNTVGLDFRGMNQDRPFLAKTHFGIESKFPWIVSLRAGLSQGYFSGGATFDLWLAKLDAAVYYEEVGVETRQSGDLRIAAMLSFNI